MSIIEVLGRQGQGVQIADGLGCSRPEGLAVLSESDPRDGTPIGDRAPVEAIHQFQESVLPLPENDVIDFREVL